MLEVVRIIILPIYICINIVNSAGIDHLSADLSWPKHKEFGQLSAVSVDKNGQIYIFHRGDRNWDQGTFDNNNRLADPSLGPLSQNTIAVLNNSGNIIATTGKNLFYMPHGLTVDDDLNVWVTDVGLHQVIKFPALNISKNSPLQLALLTLGSRLIPGKGANQFCKPTSVAVDSNNKDFFVGDGYCNARIVKFDKNGRYLIEWGKRTMPFPYPGVLGRLGQYNLNVPHSLAIDNTRHQLIVADRENFRIVFYTVNGKFVQDLPMKSRVYGVSYCSITDTLQAVTGRSRDNPGFGIILSFKENKTTSLFGNFQNAHDVAVSPDGQYIYVVEINPFTFSRFTVDNQSDKQLQATEESKVRRVNPVGSPPEVFEPEQVDVSSGNIKEGGFGFESPTLGLGANQLALTLVTASVLLAIIAVTCHIRKRTGRALPMERRGLILDDEDDR